MPYSLPSWIDNASGLNAANFGLINAAINAIAKSGHLLATAVGGTGATITVTMSPAPAAYTDCPVIIFKAAAASTGPATINPNSLGAVALVKQTNAVLAANDIKTGDTVIAVWDAVNGVYVAVNVGIAGAGGGAVDVVNARGYVSNLKIQNDAVTPNSKLSVSWDTAIMTNGSGVNVEAPSISRALDFSVVGANGIDSGVLAASNWYYAWAISDGTNTNVLGSLSSTAPTMPGGYGYKRLIGAWRTDGSANFLRAYQYNDWVYYQAQQNVLTAGNSTVFAPISLIGFVPPLSTVAMLRIFASWGATGAGAYFTSDISADNASVLFQALSYVDPGGWSFADNAQIQVPMPTAQTTYYRVSNSSARANLWVGGFRLPM